MRSGDGDRSSSRLTGRWALGLRLSACVSAAWVVLGIPELARGTELQAVHVADLADRSRVVLEFDSPVGYRVVPTEPSGAGLELLVAASGPAQYLEPTSRYIRSVRVEPRGEELSIQAVFREPRLAVHQILHLVPPRIMIDVRTQDDRIARSRPAGESPRAGRSPRGKSPAREVPPTGGAGEPAPAATAARPAAAAEVAVAPDRQRSRAAAGPSDAEPAPAAPRSARVVRDGPSRDESDPPPVPDPGKGATTQTSALPGGPQPPAPRLDAPASGPPAGELAAGEPRADRPARSGALLADAEPPPAATPDSPAPPPPPAAEAAARPDPRGASTALPPLLAGSDPGSDPSRPEPELAHAGPGAEGEGAPPALDGDDVVEPGEDGFADRPGAAGIAAPGQTTPARATSAGGGHVAEPSPSGGERLSPSTGPSTASGAGAAATAGFLDGLSLVYVAAAAAGLLAALAALGFWWRRRRDGEDALTAAVDESRELDYQQLVDDDELTDEGDVELPAMASSHRTTPRSPVSPSAAPGGSPRPTADIDEDITTLTQRLEKLEADQLNLSNIRMDFEKQLQSQRDELRSQRAAIARTQRVLADDEGIPDSEEATEPVVRGAS